ncbi:MAG: N-formylglutamate amidohydrolase [Phormidesmis sp. CAN_BIN44]|nr:N-formylglutamate amidohydrolase [Phormidesmis sp. CAN_BIN44]
MANSREKKKRLLKSNRGTGCYIGDFRYRINEIRADLVPYLALDRDARRREEDPFTARWTKLADTRLIVLRSRFEVDLNRPRDRAVYCTPSDTWGLSVWREPLLDSAIARLLAEYDGFYAELGQICRSLEQRWGHFVVFDLHTYNHWRDGQPADTALNPEINLGTGTLDRKYWSPVIERWLSDVRQFDYLGQRLHVRENAKFRGGHFPAWIHQHFPRSACVLLIEIKKFFMNEQTQLDEVQLDTVHRALESAVPSVLAVLQQMNFNPG